MDELIAQVSARTGLPPDQAKQAATAVLEFLKARVPAPLGAHIDQLLGNTSPGDSSAGGLEDIAKGVEGLFNR